MSKRPDRLRAARVLVAIVVAVLLGGTRRGVRAHRAAEARAQPRLPHARREAARAELQLPAPADPDPVRAAQARPHGLVVVGLGRPRRADAARLRRSAQGPPDVQLERARRRRAGRARGHVQAAAPPRARAPDDPDAEPDHGRPDRAADHRRLDRPACVLAGRRRAARHRPHPLPGDRAVPGARVRERPAARTDRSATPRRGVARWFGTGAAAGPVPADAAHRWTSPGTSRRRSDLGDRPDPVHLGGAARPARASRRRGSASAS